MGTPNIISNLMAGDSANVSRGLQNLGMPVVNNQTNQSGIPTPKSGVASGIATPILVGGGKSILEPGGTITPPSGIGTVPTTGGDHTSEFGISLPGQVNMSGKGITAQNTGTLLATNGVSPVASSGAIPTSATPTDTGITGQTSQQAQQLQKQLVDIYGKGTGNLLDTLINNIGSSDDAYMQAYEKAMAQPNAENLATLNTTLGNSGISMDSSAAAIANADFAAGITAQEGLQEQQLKLSDEAQLQNLVEGLEGQSAKEVSSGGFLNDLGAVFGAVGQLFSPGKSPISTLLGGLSGGGSSVGPATQSYDTDATTQLESSAQTIPLSTTDTTGLPDLSGDLIDLIGEDVFI